MSEYPINERNRVIPWPKAGQIMIKAVIKAILMKPLVCHPARCENQTFYLQPTLDWGYKPNPEFTRLLLKRACSNA